VEISLTDLPLIGRITIIHQISIHMKLTSRLVTTRKILLGITSLLSLTSFAMAAPFANSILEEARYESDSFFMDRSVLSPTQNLMGSLTLSEVYKFDYATAGIGTLIFRSNSKRVLIDTSIQDMPRAVATANSAFQSSFPNFIGAPSGFYHGGGTSPGDQSLDGDNPPVAVPEPSTWIGALFALAAIAFAQRRRLHGLVARRA
jgi:hypothetical protein